MPPFVHTTSPPVLSVPRQPSPLSFSGRTAEQFFLPTTNTSQPLPSTVTADSISLAASTVGSTAPLIQRPRREASLASPSPRPSSPSRIEALVPTGLLPDSLLCRSTFSALEHSATILKRLSKAVLASTSIYLDFLEQFEKIEDDLMTNLSELGRWLEGGYGLSESVWEVEGGIRKMRNQQRRREREELESMVEHSLIAVKTELKRTGLAGGGAQTRFEVRLVRSDW